MEDDFGLSIDMMPSFEDTLDHTDDELLDLPSFPRTSQSRESSEESIRFNPSHVDDSEDDSYVAQSELPRRTKQKVEKPVPDIEAVARDFVAQAYSNIMGSVIQSSVLGSLQNMAGQNNDQQVPSRSRNTGRDSPDQASSDRFETTYSDSDYEDDDDDEDVTMGMSDQSRRDELVDSNISEDASSLNIEDEFDFLDDYGSSPEKK